MNVDLGADRGQRRTPTRDVSAISWRREQLLRHGFDERLAGELAANLDVDLHAVLDLVARGCPPLLAERILAPVSDSGSDEQVVR